MQPASISKSSSLPHAFSFLNKAGRTCQVLSLVNIVAQVAALKLGFAIPTAVKSIFLTTAFSIGPLAISHFALALFVIGFTARVISNLANQASTESKKLIDTKLQEIITNLEKHQDTIRNTTPEKGFNNRAANLLLSNLNTLLYQAKSQAHHRPTDRHETRKPATSQPHAPVIADQLQPYRENLLKTNQEYKNDKMCSAYAKTTTNNALQETAVGLKNLTLSKEPIDSEIKEIIQLLAQVASELEATD